MTTMTEVVEWIEKIGDSDLDVVLAALQARHDALHEARAERATVGTDVVIDDVTADYLVGLEGRIEASDPDEGVVDVRLTTASTGRLRFSGQVDLPVGVGFNYLLRGVPASCCYPAEHLAATG